MTVRPRRVKVAMILPRFPDANHTFVVRRFLALVERGWDVHIFHERGPRHGRNWFPELSGSEVKRRLHQRRFGPSHARIVLTLPVVFVRALLSAPMRTLRFVVRGRRAYGRELASHFVEDESLLRFGPHIVHFEFGYNAVNREPMGDLLDCAFVVSFQGGDVSFANLDREPGYYQALWMDIDAAHFVSKDLLERAKHRGFPADGPAFLVYNGIDLKTFTPTQRRHTDIVGTPHRPVRLLSVGRLHWQKGYAYALQAVRLLVDSGLHCDYRIIGDGDLRDGVLFDVRDLALDGVVTLLGPRPASEVREAMTWADVVVHPAICEGFCLAVTEAQAMGVPVVASDAEGLRENVADGVSGFIVARRDARSLADRIAELARDPELRSRMGRAGAERVATNFDLNAHIAGIERIYRFVLKGRQEKAKESQQPSSERT